MTEAQSATTFLLGDRLPWPDDGAIPWESGPLDGAVLHNSGLRSDCSIRKISANGATLRPKIAAAPGESLALELGTGQRVSGKIEWARDSEIGMHFTQPIDVLALINRTLVSQPVDRRAMPRVELRCNAWIKHAQDFSPAVMRNVSARGLQLEGAGLPPKGTYVSVFVEGLNIPPGEVVWTQGKLAGVELLEELSWSSIMPWIRGLVRSEPQ